MKPKPFYRIRISGRDNIFIVYKIGYSYPPVKTVKVGIFCDNQGNGTAAYNKAKEKYNIPSGKINTESTYEDFCSNLYVQEKLRLSVGGVTPLIPKRAMELGESFFEEKL